MRFAEIGQAEVGVILTGVGPRHAAIAASTIEWGTPGSIDLCISSGVAGALRQEHKIGDVLAARAVVSEDARSDEGSGVLDCSAALISVAADCGARIADRFYSANRVISRAEEKQRLGAAADAVEMESFEIMQRARADGVPAIAIRAISDAVDEDLPLEMNEIFNEEGRVSMPRVIGQAALHPRSVPGLIRLGQKSKRAAEALAVFLDRYVTTLAGASKLESEVSVAAR